MADARTDRELVEAARAGDAAAFEALYLRHRDLVLRVATRFLAHDDDALDVLQETFLYVLRKLPELDLRAKFSTLLFPVARNLALQQGRRRRRQAAVDDEPVDERGAAGAEVDELAELVAGLPEAQREVVLLRFVDGLELAAIAARLGVPVGTVKSRLHQAIGRLREDPRLRRHFGG